MAVYLLHFDQPLGHARHYSGYSRQRDCQQRLERHAAGIGARLLKVALERGISWQVAKIWPEGDRAFERSLKARGQTAICPLCRAEYLLEKRKRDARYRAKKRAQSGLALSINNQTEIPMAAKKETTLKAFEIGKAYFIRTVTYHLTGRLVAIDGQFLILEKAAWIADSGRFTQALRDGKLDEVEPVGQAIVNNQSIVDAFPWQHDLPEVQK